MLMKNAHPIIPTDEGSPVATASLAGCAPKRGKFARTLVLAGVMLLTLEGAARLRVYLRYGQTGTVASIYARDPHLGNVPRAGARMVLEGATTTVNRWGLRGSECAVAKTPGVLRILCLGESTTFGQPSDDDESVWPARLERLLRAEGIEAEVLNGAVIGFSVSQSRLRYETELARFSPDIVVINHAATNIAAHARRQFASPATGEGARWSWAKLRGEYSLAYNLLRENTAGMLAAEFPAGRCDHLDQKGVRFFERELEGLIDACEASGARVVLCTFPRAFGAEQPPAERGRLARTALFFNPRLSVRGLMDAYERYNAVIREVAARRGLALADLDRAVPRGAADFQDAVHLSARGHAAVAQSVADTVRGLQPVRLTRRGEGGDHAVQ